MSQVSICPTCGSKSKIKEKNGEFIYKVIQDEEAFTKIVQLKKSMLKFKEKAEKLEKEVTYLKSKKK